MFGDSKHCRKILQKALNSVTDWPESITQAYINFEREEGIVCPRQNFLHFFGKNYSNKG